MKNKILHLFVDTNFFIQCKAIKEIQWSNLLESTNLDTINLYVTKPVQKELDSFKASGNTRLGRRARKATSLFKEIITDHNFCLTYSLKPDITLNILIKPELGFSKDQNQILDINEKDDQIIATALKFKNENLNEDIRVLTADTGPMATAKAVGLEFIAIPDNWLLPPEQSKEQKELEKLEKENKRLLLQEPKISMVCIDGQENVVEEIKHQEIIYDHLSEKEVDELICQIKKHFPIVEDFGSSEADERELQSNLPFKLNLKEVYTPAKHDDINKYKNKSYPDWVTKCREIISSYHETLNSKRNGCYFYFIAQNEGTRPANSTLITIKAEGDFYLSVPDDDERTGSETEIALPFPPKAPKGRWSDPLSTDMGRFHEAMKGIAAFKGIGLYSDSTFPRIADLHPIKHDSNGFYYKPKRPFVEKEMKLECDQWRHDTRECFSGKISFDKDEVRGLISFRVEAENLSNPQELKIPIHIKINRVSSFDKASILVNDLIKSVQLKKVV